MGWCNLILVSLVLMHHGTLKPNPLDDLTINLNLNDAPNDEEISGDETFDEGQEVKAGQTNEITAFVVGGFGPDQDTTGAIRIRTQKSVRTFRNGKWVLANPALPEPRKGMGITNHLNVIHVAGGLGQPYGEQDDIVLDTVIYRNENGRSWVAHSVLTQKRAYATLNSIQNQQGELTLMVTGGQNEFNQALSSTEIHTPGVGWFDAPPMIDTRYGHASAVLQGWLFVLGGQGSCMMVGRCTEYFDTTRQQWIKGPELTEERRFPAAAVLENGNEALIYICGGFRGTQEFFSNTCERGNINGFVRIADMNFPRAQFGLLNMGTELWAIGGLSDDGSLKKMEKYKDNGWTNFPMASFMRRKRELFGAVTIII